MYGNEDHRFSSPRGVHSVNHTRTLLSGPSWEYLDRHPQSSAILETPEGRKVLLVHGDLSDPLWGPMSEAEMRNDHYRRYDFVLSGHSHKPHFREVFFEVDDPARRNRRKVIFLNPGSVGQPRNHCPLAQYLLLDTITEEVVFRKVPYDIAAEQERFSPEVDPFYRERLREGL